MIKRFSRFFLFAAALSLLVPGPSAVAGQLTGVELAKQVNVGRQLDGSEMLSTLKIANKKGQTRIRKMATVSKLFDNGATERRLIRFVSPADIKGTGLLTFDYENKTDDLWLYMPSRKKTRRIVASQKAKSFMGSEFTYADITPPSIDDFKYEITGSATEDGVDCWILRATPKNESIADENGYSKRDAYVGKTDLVVRRAVYHDRDGELWRELTATDVKLVDKDKARYRAHHMKIVNHQNGRTSELLVEQLNLRADIPDDYFTTRYLERD
jgi:Outer membrane lipoprotein-sorting protein